MSSIWASLWLLWAIQIPVAPAYVLEGDRVEREFRLYTVELERFFVSLQDTVEREAPALLPRLDAPPPEPVVYGYQLLPPVLDRDLTPVRDSEPASRSYSWPITEGYVSGETEKLRRAQARLANATGTGSLDSFDDLITEYEALVENQKVVDQHVQYNRLWQREVDSNRSGFDRMTELYDLVMDGDADTTRIVREALGRPRVPEFLDLDRSSDGRLVLRLPVYTDIADIVYLERIEAATEEIWQAVDEESAYALEIEFRAIAPETLYEGADPPGRGAHIDVSAHATRFPGNGAVLTTGAESTHAFVGRSILLGAAEISTRTLAHEFGHLLGFRDGYIRGYRDLGNEGFEILELVPAFDDIMSAPSSGGAQPVHFGLILDALEERQGQLRDE